MVNEVFARRVTKNAVFVRIGKFELFFSYGELFGVFDGEWCYRLPSPRRSTMVQYNKWADSRKSQEVDAEKLRVLVHSFISPAFV